MRALFVHSDPVVRDRYEAALGMPIVFVNRGSFSDSYSEVSGLAHSYPTLNSAVRRYMPDLPESEPVVLLGFSAGCWAVRAWLREIEARQRCAAVVLIDGLHSSGTSAIAGVIDYALEAVAGKHALVITHSQIRTDRLTEKPYASTRQTADLVLRQVGLARLNFDESVHKGHLHIISGPGADGAAHVRQLREVGPRACKEYVTPTLVPTLPAPPPDDSDDPTAPGADAAMATMAVATQRLVDDAMERSREDRDSEIRGKDDEKWK